MDTLYVHADESCLGNQFQTRANPGGAAGLVELWKDGAWERRDYWISEPDATNNRMAIRSGIEVLTSLTRRHRVYFVSDSQYLVNGINEWMPGWKKASWKRKAGPIKNLELWRSLDKQLQGARSDGPLGPRSRRPPPRTSTWTSSRRGRPRSRLGRAA